MPQYLRQSFPTYTHWIPALVIDLQSLILMARKYTKASRWSSHALTRVAKLSQLPGGTPPRQTSPRPFLSHIHNYYGCHKFELSKQKYEKVRLFPSNQGDQIGQIFAHWAIIYFGQFFYLKQPTF
jgi:hypothetical protein